MAATPCQLHLDRLLRRLLERPQALTPSTKEIPASRVADGPLDRCGAARSVHRARPDDVGAPSNTEGWVRRRRGADCPPRRSPQHTEQLVAQLVGRLEPVVRIRRWLSPTAVGGVYRWNNGVSLTAGACAGTSTGSARSASQHGRGAADREMSLPLGQCRDFGCLVADSAVDRALHVVGSPHPTEVDELARRPPGSGCRAQVAIDQSLRQVAERRQDRSRRRSPRSAEGARRSRLRNAPAIP
jgi:hypothetical protein